MHLESEKSKFAKTKPERFFFKGKLPKKCQKTKKTQGFPNYFRKNGLFFFIFLQKNTKKLSIFFSFFGIICRNSRGGVVNKNYVFLFFF